MPGDYQNYGEWLHYLLETTPGWWNNNGSKSVDAQTIIFIALGYELAGNLDKGQVVFSVAEAFARKAWGGFGFYRKLDGVAVPYDLIESGAYGSRENFKTKLDTKSLMTPLKPEVRPDLAFASMLATTMWHQMDPSRPYEWANIVQTNPEWFKVWINNRAPEQNWMGGSFLDPSNPSTSIWLRITDTNNYPDDTLYILTYKQFIDLGCDDVENGCVGFTKDNKPYSPKFLYDFLPEYAPK